MSIELVGTYADELIHYHRNLVSDPTATLHCSGLLAAGVHLLRHLLISRPLSMIGISVWTRLLHKTCRHLEHICHLFTMVCHGFNIWVYKTGEVATQCVQQTNTARVVGEEIDGRLAGISALYLIAMCLRDVNEVLDGLKQW